MSEIYDICMQRAIDEARLAAEIGEVPVGAVVAIGDRIISAAHNTRETDKNALMHAEIKAIDEACKALGGWRLFMCDLYVTLEPCSMCAGAIINSRIKRVIFGASDKKAGAFGGLYNTLEFPHNHIPEIISGVKADEAQAILKEFFVKLRKKEG